MREFNDTGLCVRHLHYMADTNPQMNRILETLIEPGKYFTITGGRQFGKTTTIALIADKLAQRDDYLLIETSFEGIGDIIFEDEESFNEGFLSNLYNRTKQINPTVAEDFKKAANLAKNFDDLADFITGFTRKQKAKVVLIIDEVDKSSNNQLFLSFLGMLRDKYLLRNRGKDHTFHSVILAGVHDVKTMKVKMRESGAEKLNSPWNIATDFNIDLSFNPKQIATLLDDYLTEHPDTEIHKQKVAEKLYYYTSGYPFLVSKMCKFIDEDIIRNRDNKNWLLNDVETAFKTITNGGYTNTLFDSIAKNLQNNEELYRFIYEIVIENRKKAFQINDKMVYLAKTHALIRNENGECAIHNRIFEQRIYNLMLSIMDNTGRFTLPYHQKEYYKGEDIDLEYILKRFQVFFKENYSHTDKKFLEREGRLVFLSYLQPIINGRGYVFKEPVSGEDRRMDLVITYNEKRYIVELKLWYGDKYYKEGLQQVSDYLDIYSLKEGYMLIFNFNKNKEFKTETVSFNDKKIFIVWT